ncbi:acyl-CoA dehydrogenase family protein [Ketobacter sp.]|uniref:acyl-CoA dehydrogenase family protein n=1 Tax=Ketobacter sp. TaxID=2083498 RepID=UPI000F1F3BA9|nr:acyl-CoA dehydrogenase family protein [Ketobacter sp.]RLT97339.1 MAG: oxidoreductase [Ketobacter sp.]
MSDQSAASFDLTLTEEQRITRESIRRFVESHIKPNARAADEAAAAPADFYRQASELGLGLMPIPEALGGAGMARAPISNVLNAEDLGQGDMALAIGALTPLSFINAVLDFASPVQQETYLTPLAMESLVATIALMEPKATFEPTALQTSAVKVDGGYQLNGVKTLVPLATQSRFILVLAALDGEAASAGFVVESAAEGMTIQEESCMGLRPLELCRVELHDVVVPESARINLDMGRLLDLSSIGLAAVAVGCCQAVLDYVVPYVNDRTAFGEPISHRQSVAFMVADMATELEAMRLLVYRAASRAEQGLAFHENAYWCRTFCSEKAMEIGTNGIQLLGGHGFIREHPVEMWYRNLRAAALLQGAVVI